MPDEPVVEPVVEPKVEPAPEPKVEPVVEPAVEPVVEPEPKMIPADVAQKRIDRMYARLQAEKVKHAPVVKPQVDEFGDPVEQKGMTREELEATLDAREVEKQFMRNEGDVFLNHPDMLNDDGSYNLDNKYMKMYMRIGEENPQLASMVNGPKIAEAMMEKEFGLSYVKGRVDEANNLKRGTVDNYTAKSTGSPPTSAITGKLSDAEKKVARNQGLTEAEYLANKTTSRIPVKDWSVK